jgi:LuxR family maltose regulon positive regulatory protein
MRLLDGAAGRSGPAALGFAVAGRVAAHRGDGVAADQLLDRALGLVDWLTGAMPWLAVRARLEAARLAVVLGRSEVALALCQAAQDMPGRWLSGPGTGDDLPLQALFARGAADAWAATLSPAELRVLPLLATHLSFREIGERLFVSRNTVKTQAISIYRKLGVNSRNQAVTRAGALGLIVA